MLFHITIETHCMNKAFKASEFLQASEILDTFDFITCINDYTTTYDFFHVSCFFILKSCSAFKVRPLIGYWYTTNQRSSYFVAR